MLLNTDDVLKRLLAAFMKALEKRFDEVKGYLDEELPKIATRIAQIIADLVSQKITMQEFMIVMDVQKNAALGVGSAAIAKIHPVVAAWTYWLLKLAIDKVFKGLKKDAAGAAVTTVQPQPHA
jgi:hypothetical protein